AHFPEQPGRRPTLISGDASIEFTEWMVPTLGQRSRDPVEAPDGSIWWTGMWASLAGRLDPETGEERWVFDPEIDLKVGYANQLICRGVSTWRDRERSPGDVCARRIFTATNDARLIALDAATGLPCPDFGNGNGDRPGEVDLTAGVGERRWPGEYQVTSPPAILGDRVIVGSAVSDNGRVDAPSGVVRAYDARNGALLWAWDPVPAGFRRRAMDQRQGVQWALGTANVWAPMSVDEERDLVFAPTGNTAPDYYGGVREGVDLYASSVVALHGETGEVAWHYQTVHHDVWDYDVPAQPTLGPLQMADGRRIDAVFQATKMGHVFVLNRDTGESLFPVEERPVPQDPVVGEQLSPTQPFPVKPPPLGGRRLTPEDAWGLTPWDRGWCRQRIEELRSEGIFTPPSLQGTTAFPGNAGGTNWGGLAVDPERQILVVNTSNIPFLITLFPGEEFDARRDAEQAKLQEKIKELEQRQGVDPQQMILEIATAQQVGQKRLDAAAERMTRQRDRQMDEIDEAFESRFDASGSWSRPPQPVDTALHHKEVETEIFACLDAAPLRQTLAFILREVEELSTEDICNVLGITRTNLGVMLHRIRNRVRDCLESKGVRR
ncbi:MAG: PQQ-binding-like beta-propeller repeat protein, partial [Planctomycetes bacterium]|nr:PQQ-binding-like beta-propeller repeat protein [Planctomycetota bacterium]